MSRLSSPIHTARLDLVAITIEHLELELQSQAQLGEALGTTVPEGWPPGLYDHDAIVFFRDRLRAEGVDSIGWYGWYGVLRATAEAPSVLVGSAGFFGPPRGGETEIGYSIVESLRKRGFATEMVVGLVDHVRHVEALSMLVAHTTMDNVASQQVLRRAGFELTGMGAEPGMLKFTQAIRHPRLP
ncbi:MAG: GNAT family N-acetyltransferase [Polyangiales bacterium]